MDGGMVAGGEHAHAACGTSTETGVGWPPAPRNASSAEPGRSQEPVLVPPSRPRLPGRGRWQLFTHLPCDPRPESVGEARAHVRETLGRWGSTLADIHTDVLLVATELLTNAVVASMALEPARPVRLWVCSDWARVLVQIGDESPLRPRLMPVRPDTLNGRGLSGVVVPLSTCWGWFPATDHGLAKVVWAEIAGKAAGPASLSVREI